MKQHAMYTATRVFLRLLLAFITLCLRLIYAYYLDLDMFKPGPLQTSFWIWTCIICGLVYAVALPSTRTPQRHPNQRASDRRTGNVG
jgi:hypothetical protein